MKAGLVGFAGSGKTTLMSAMTGLGAAGAGPRGKANLGTIKVPDERVDRLSQICKPKKTTYAEVVFIDVPGPAGGAKSFDSASVQALKEADALVLVLGAYDASQDPVRTLSDFLAELLLGDLEMIEKRLDRIKREKDKGLEQELLGRLRAALDDNRPLRELELGDADEKLLSSYSFLTQRPLLAVVNVAEAGLAEPLPEALSAAFAEAKLEPVIVCAKLEAEVAALEPAERGAFLEELGVKEPASSQLIRAAYRALDYVSFFTTGEDEVKAWTVRRGSKAPRAAGRIHSDIERGFIRAEVIRYEDFVALGGSEAKARESGKLKLEGKEYVIQDGDCVHFRFAV
jgi:ribosome-binding ATPase